MTQVQDPNQRIEKKAQIQINEAYRGCCFNDCSARLLLPFGHLNRLFGCSKRSPASIILKIPARLHPISPIL